METSRFTGRRLLPLLLTLAVLSLLIGGCKSKEGGAAAPADGTAPATPAAAPPSAGTASNAPGGGAPAAPPAAGEPQGSGQTPGTASAAPGGAPATPPLPGHAPVTPAPPLFPSGPPGQVVAKVNGASITRGVL